MAGSWQGSGRVVAGERHGMYESAFNTAGERHGMCESAYTLPLSEKLPQDTTSKPRFQIQLLLPDILVYVTLRPRILGTVRGKQMTLIRHVGSALLRDRK
jgi:hypothetical protein